MERQMSLRILYRSSDRRVLGDLARVLLWAFITALAWHPLTAQEKPGNALAAGRCDVADLPGPLQQVSISSAFEMVIKLSAPSNASAMSRDSVKQYLCKALRDDGVEAVLPNHVVSTRIEAGFAEVRGYFAVTPDSVWLLNRVEQGVVTSKVDLEAWNTVVSRGRPSTVFADVVAVLRYGCQVGAVVANMGSVLACSPDRRASVEQEKSGDWKVKLPDRRLAIAVRQDGYVLSVK